MQAYTDALPNNCVFLVDTYDTLQGVRHAIAAGHRLRDAGHELVGIRLDSGDLAWLSIEARRMLDEAGFPGAIIVASNDLDERLVASLKQQGARITDWGVGTRLVTAWDQPALGGVYKLGAIRAPGGAWEHRIKLSEQAVKTSTPGILQVRRFYDGRHAAGDLVWDEVSGIEPPAEGTAAVLIDPHDVHRRKRIPADWTAQDLLVPVFRGGRCVYDPPPLDEVRAFAARELSQLPPEVRRFDNPHEYPVGLEPRLHELKQRLIRQARGIE